MTEQTELAIAPAEPVPGVAPAEQVTSTTETIDGVAVPTISAEEIVAWIGLALLALVSRVWRLGDPPLNIDEGRRALEAWTLLRDGRVAYDGAPILTNLTSIVFTVFTDGDIQARLVPALCGVLLVLAPLLMRPLLGGWWSLLAALCLASSSVFLTASRSVSPAIPAVLCLAVTAFSAWRFGASHERRWLTTTLIAALVGIGVDTSFIVGSIGLLLAYAIAEGEIFGRASWWEPVAAHGRRALAIGIGAAVVLDTRFLMSPGGIQAGLIDPLTRWTTEVARGAGLTAPLLVGMLDGGILVLAVVGLFAYGSNPRAIRFLGTWLLVSLTLASLMRMPDLRYLTHPILPAALLAGFGLVRLAGWLTNAGSSRAILVGLAALVPIVTASFQVNAGLRQNLSPWDASAVVLITGLLLVGVLGYYLLQWREVHAALATWLLVLVTVFTISSGSRSLEARGDDRGQLIEQTVVTRDMAFIREIALKWYRASPDGPLPVDPSLRPLLAWPLRDIPTIRYDPAASSQPYARLLADPPPVTGPDTVTIRPIVGYVTDWGTFSLQPARVWRWFVNRETLVTLRPYAIVIVQPPGS